MNILTRTADGSNTFFNETIGEHYHSSHGAYQESKHVFIEAGLKYAHQQHAEQPIHVLEVGFGTGLNFLLSSEYAENNGIALNYLGIEAFPLSLEQIKCSEYDQLVSASTWDNFIDKYERSFNTTQELSPFCQLTIAHEKLEDFNRSIEVDLLYFDAFSVRHQPELWTNEMIAHTCSFIKPAGVFVTYAITGNLKRALKACGMKIEKLPGAPGKREMLRAIKCA